MSVQYFSMGAGEGAAQRAVHVPLNQKTLAPMDPERVRRLRRHLVDSLRALRRLKDPVASASPTRPPLEGLADKVVRTACSMCKGVCCKGGGEHAYLDERVMARVRLAQPELDARAVLSLYLRVVPEVSYGGSCIFHGAQGCTLDRSLRADLCNIYYCTGLGDFMHNENPPTAVVVISAEGEQMQMSPVLTA